MLTRNKVIERAIVWYAMGLNHEEEKQSTARAYCFNKAETYLSVINHPYKYTTTEAVQREAEFMVLGFEKGTSRNFLNYISINAPKRVAAVVRTRG